MYTLRLLGTLSIEAPDRTLTGRAAQGRRLALLAILALARGRALSRDKLVALLWPEATPERARPQLSDTLYILRHALGEDAVRSSGDGLALNTDIVASDIAEFERLLRDGRLEEAVALYCGPLLDGFHVPDSVEFESWLDGERAELDRRYAHALESLAEAAEAAGDHDAALGWWRRRAAHDPYNGRVALRLMHALDAAGDRAGALQHARIHAALLREEFGAEPGADVTALAERLRSEPPPPATTPAAAKLIPPPSTPNAIPATMSAPADAAALETHRTPADDAALETHRTPADDAALETHRTPTDAAALETHLTPISAVTSPPPGAPTSAPIPRRRFRTGALAAAATLVLVTAIGTVLAMRRNGAPVDARSVGVLPFVNMSADPANTYFSDGLSEQIILALSRIDGLRVAARTSSFALRDRELNIRAIADTLNVHAVLEGSVLVEGGRLRVIAQLIDARTGFHIWSDQYDGDLRDAFAVQDSIALAMAGALRLRLAGTATPRTEGRAPGFAAYDLYLRGLYLRNSLSADALLQAASYFDRVIELEPRFALAWAAKASVIAPQAYFRYANRDSVVAELRVLTERALELDPTLGEAHASLGVLRLFYEWDWAGAGAALRRAVELNPNDAHAWHHLGNYHAATGSMHDAIAARERAVQLDPLNARTRIVLSRDYLIAGDFERALEEARRAAQLDPVHPLMLGRSPSLPVGAGEVFLRLGREDDAVEEYLRVATLRGATRAELETMRAAYESSGMPAFWSKWLEMDLRQSGPSPDPVRMAVTHLLMGDTVQALDWLDRAFDEHNPALIYLRRDPNFNALSTHPRVGRIARAMKFPD